MKKIEEHTAKECASCFGKFICPSYHGGEFEDIERNQIMNDAVENFFTAIEDGWKGSDKRLLGNIKKEFVLNMIAELQRIKIDACSELSMIISDMAIEEIEELKNVSLLSKKRRNEFFNRLQNMIASMAFLVFNTQQQHELEQMRKETEFKIDDEKLIEWAKLSPHNKLAN